MLHALHEGGNTRHGRAPSGARRLGSTHSHRRSRWQLAGRNPATILEVVIHHMPSPAVVAAARSELLANWKCKRLRAVQDVGVSCRPTHPGLTQPLPLHARAALKVQTETITKVCALCPGVIDGAHRRTAYALAPIAARRCACARRRAMAMGGCLLRTKIFMQHTPPTHRTRTKGRYR